MSDLKGVLETYTAPELKKMIRAANITGYSKLKKNELVTLMTRAEHKHNFDSVKSKDKRKPNQDTKESKAKSKVLKEFQKKAKVAKAMFEGKEASKELGKKIEKKFGKKEEEPKKEEKPKTVRIRKKKPKVIVDNKNYLKLFKDIKEIKETIKTTYNGKIFQQKLSMLTPKEYGNRIKEDLQYYLDRTKNLYKKLNIPMTKEDKKEIKDYFYTIFPKKQKN
jgi:hypothetical protein